MSAGARRAAPAGPRRGPRERAPSRKGGTLLRSASREATTPSRSEAGRTRSREHDRRIERGDVHVEHVPGHAALEDRRVPAGHGSVRPGAPEWPGGDGGIPSGAGRRPWWRCRGAPSSDSRRAMPGPARSTPAREAPRGRASPSRRREHRPAVVRDPRGRCAGCPRAAGRSAPERPRRSAAPRP